jgi:hypothetical protein
MSNYRQIGFSHAMQRRGLIVLLGVLALAFCFLMLSTLRPPPRGALAADIQITLARDDGRYANDPLKPWFDQLASGKGLCCSFADGQQVNDVDWDTQDGRYRVRLNGEWIVVPDAALVTEPNKFGPAVVWPYLDAEGSTQIRCFLPGAGA